MRRMITFVALVLVLLAATPALAQAPFSYGFPNQGILQYTTASISCSNSTSACALWSALVPAAYTATSPNTNWTPSNIATPPPMHLQLRGQLTTNIGVGAVGTLNLGVNYGGGSSGVASLALVNAAALPNNMNSVPWQLDVWFAPIATATNGSLPAASACYVWLNARMTIASITANNGLNSPLYFENAVCGQTGGAFLASAQQLNVLANWGSASLTNSLNQYNGVLYLGN